MKIIGANVTGSFILNSQDVTTTIQTSNVWSGSVATDITALNAATASLLNYTSSNNAAISDILLETASFNAFSSSILNYTSSTNAAISDILLETASINLLTASLLSYTSSQNNRNGTYATTGSNTFTGIQTVNSNLVVTGSITAQTLIVQTITSSQDFVTGSTRFGSLAINTHQFTGSVIVTGSLNATAFTGSGAGLTSIPNAALTNSTISGIALGSNLATLTIGTGLSGTSYNGSTAVTIANSGVTSIVAGTGISINQGTAAVTVTNTITNNNQLTNGAGYITSAGNAATATNLSTDRTNWSTNGTLTAVVGQLAWKNYGNNHTIIDASAGTAPNGASINATNANTVWTSSYPTLMGWNGSGTYGVRVDSARIADSTSGNAATATLATTATTTTGNAGSVTYLPNRADSAAYPILWGAAYSNTIGTIAYSCAAVTIQSSTGTVNATTFSGALSTAQNVVFSNGRKGLVGVYDAAQTQAIFSMGAPYLLTDGGASNVYGPLYGLGWSYNPDYGGSGNNPQSKAGLNHQLLHMQNGVTTTAIGSGIWTGGSITATGDITAYYSDIRLKTKISNIANALDKVMKLNGFYYVNNDVAKEYGYTSDKVQIGVSAQEVESILPEIVMLAPFDATGADAENPLSKSGEHYKTVKYDKLVPLLIEAIKEQQTQIEELKTLINGLTK